MFGTRSFSPLPQELAAAAAAAEVIIIIIIIIIIINLTLKPKICMC